MNAISCIIAIFGVLVFSFFIKRLNSVIAYNKHIYEKNLDKKIEANEKADITNDIYVFADDTNSITQNENLTENENAFLGNVIQANDLKEFDWSLKIPEINLYAKIEEGTTDEILNRSIGHFDDSSKEIGNVCLAAHNRGYRVNYFSKLKDLKIGSKIYYYIDNKLHEYEIVKIEIIYETDWSMLEDTEDNRITLVTCVENKGEYRLCAQGVEVGKTFED